jgi:aminopeptidase N
MIHRTLIALLAALPVLLGAAAQAQPGPLRFDPETGRDLANYLPHRDFDHTRMVLELDFPDFESQARASARCALTMAAIGTTREVVRLDARGYRVERVGLAGHEGSLGFSHEGDEVRVRLPRPAAPGEQITLTFEYELGPEQMAPNGRALSWSPPTRRPDNPTEASPMLHSQGQPEDARAWFPCYDHPLERLSTELIVTVDEGFEVISNGELRSNEPTGDGRRRWHWVQELPHAPYLVSLVIGRFEVVELVGPDSAYPGLPMPVYGPVGSGEALRAAFGVTPAMLAHFETLFDEPYPWVKYSQTVVRDFAAGAMENTSASTFFPMAASATPGSIDGLIAHELVHQWFGNLVTCRSWAHLWLQEGWATYGEALWEEEQARREALDAGATADQADAAARRAYRRAIAPHFRAASAAAGVTSDPDSPALASPYWTDPEQNFMKADSPYSRGACVLHMLRERLGDEVFFQSARLYLDRHRFGAVETHDFRRVLEEVSGESLERFFAQWVHRAGAPKADVRVEWEADYPEDRDGPGTLRITLRQVQPIDEWNPAYALVVPIFCRFDNGSSRYVYVRTDTREAVVTERMDRAPEDVRVDPFHWNILDARLSADLDH